MRQRDMQRLMLLVDRLSRVQRQALVHRLAAQTMAMESIELVESAGRASRRCPHCAGSHIVRNGMADELQRYKCRTCGKSFNALTGTPLARLRHKGKWLGQTQAMADGLTVHRTAERLGVAPSTAFRWRHRFLAVPRELKPQALTGVVEIDETYVLESFKGRAVVGRKARRRGGSAARRGLSREQIPVLVARDRAGTTTDAVLPDSRKTSVVSVLKPLLPCDVVVCSDGGGAIGQAVKDLGLEHHPVVIASGIHALGAWHIQNVNAYHGRLKQWLRRFNGVATAYLENYLGWIRHMERTTRTPAQPARMLSLAIRA